MKRIFLASTSTLLCLAVFASISLAHSGGTNADGCHTNRKTGDYHCHNSKPRQNQDQTYCHVIHGQNRCGYAKSTCEDLKSQFGGVCVKQ